MFNKTENQDEFVLIDNQEFYKIANFQEMAPFFISLASNCDLWLFISSNGGLTGGRKNADYSLFPYETEDKINAGTNTGPKTLIRIIDSEKIQLWEPFLQCLEPKFKIKRNIYKNTLGNSLLFEEENLTLGLVFRYQWSFSEKFGLIRTSSVINNNQKEINLEIIDGLANILPFGIPIKIQETKSCLADAYKASELEVSSKMGIYYLTSQIDDSPAASEMLKANVVWSHGLTDTTILLSDNGIKKFLKGEKLTTELISQGKKLSYFLNTNLKIKPKGSETWQIIADVGLDQVSILSLQDLITKQSTQLLEIINQDINKSTEELAVIVGISDGFQTTNDKMTTVHHLVNVLYNNMRGGVFLDGYNFNVQEFIDFVKIRNFPAYKKNLSFFANLSQDTYASVFKLKELAFTTKNVDIIRLTLEFLPLSFSRRHGDPSRPWNRFSINTKNKDGKRAYHYEGNWRDIFQNWEAMALSFPEYLENMVVKFVNASTLDGFNPYRINQAGIEWEVLDPDDPWSSIGYWGDHQIIYLLKLLEALENHYPERLNKFLNEEIFCYANVPYEIKPYQELLKDNKNTIILNQEKADIITENVEKIGTDGKLILKDNNVYNVNLTEKILVPILAKLSNFVLDGGIWMNTQRPEWNDANNAIVGNGISMVTTYFLRRHLHFYLETLKKAEFSKLKITKEVLIWFEDINQILKQYLSYLTEKEIDLKTKKVFLDKVAEAFSHYRETIYKKGVSGKTEISKTELCKFCEITLKYLDHAVDINKNEHNLYNAYNIYKIASNNQELLVQPLYEMLEGQVAVLGSNRLSPKQVLKTLNSVAESALYWPQKNTYFLYPKRVLPLFLQKNIIPQNLVMESSLLVKLLNEQETSIIIKDILGNIRFNQDFSNAQDLLSALKKLAENSVYQGLVEQELEKIMDIFEAVFKHKEFTGRSGIMFKYEGIGCVYWHQNSKFLLAVQECFFNAYQQKVDQSILEELKNAYYQIRAGLGFNQSAKEWGAFPFDPYSHTSGCGTAQQPGMTGQVKEEIITRRGELGVIVKEGQVYFLPFLLRKQEFLPEKTDFKYLDTDLKWQKILVNPNELAFTFCQVPIIYTLANENKIIITKKDNSELVILGNCLDHELSSAIFRKNGEIKSIKVLIC